MVTFLMTFTDLNRVFKVTTLFEVEYLKNGASFRDNAPQPQETIPNIWNGTMFGNLD